MSSLLALLLLVGPAFTSAELDKREPTIGMMEVLRRAPTERERRQSLELQRLDVTVEVHGDVAQTRVEHDFYNASDERLEGTFRFPLPMGAEITGLAMEVDGRMIQGELVERQKAERIFDQIVDEMRDPALLTWEAGNLFTLRVFPIEPSSHKRVVIRYATPLEGNGRKARYVFAAQAAPLAARIGRFRFTVDGKMLYDDAQFQPRTITVEVPQEGIADRSLREVVDGSTYLRVKLPVAVTGRAQVRGRDRWVLVVDVSRSALEARSLTLDAVRAALSALPDRDQFMVLACDIQCRETAFAPVTPAAAAGALRFLDSIEPDGATDLGAALRLAAERAHGPAHETGGQVLYFGDGNATWGVTDEAELAQQLAPAFVEVPLHAVILGKYARPALLTRLSNRAGGILATPSRKADLTAFSQSLGQFGRVSRISDITLSVKNAVVTPARPASIGVGQELTAFLRCDGKVPSTVHLTARLNGRPFAQELPMAAAVTSQEVARRFAASRIRELELDGGHDEEALALSLKHQVMSTKTAWLVLENDETYRKYQIERHQKQQSADPSVSGKDLESTDGKSAQPDVGGEGPEPELWLLCGLAMLAFWVRRRLVVAR